MPPGSKRCRKCDRILPLDAFYRDSSPKSRQAHHARCKRCKDVANRVNIYRQGAKRRGLAFELTKRQVDALIARPCALCGAPATESAGAGGLGVHGIDRWRNDLGYVEGNCIPCCWNCNRMKGPLDGEAFLDRIRRITRHVRENPIRAVSVTPEPRAGAGAVRVGGREDPGSS